MATVGFKRWTFRIKTESVETVTNSRLQQFRHGILKRSVGIRENKIANGGNHKNDLI